MVFTIIGLGNPGEEYENTRHNAGRMLTESFRTANDFPEWKLDKKSNSMVSKGKIGPHTVTLVLPETFMNKSGTAAKNFATNPKAAERMMVIYDDLDLPFGVSKISFNKSFGGHKGVESIIKSIKTEAFPRMRVGVAKVTAKGTAKKPAGEGAVIKYILGKFSPDELSALKKLSKKANEALELWITEGREKAMNAFN